MDPIYWRTRCEAAEKALQLARAGLEYKPQRRTALAALGELRPSETITTGALATKLGWALAKTQKILSGMERLGLVDRANGVMRTGGPGNQAKWKLGYLVQLQPEASE